ncbi:RES family NAD+ phosphorylase [Roseateles koreensis]|uniref:RES family NAD+ phosphorylase n=1 Tax=Roseateles koreensis TaxID=2987526 RepID=A0ABT5KMU5_9BURK|nr:RES family NAD+ phosphorylase [Roseateles koreensis]MDC8784247.1 RES family NAD+ phosphorylase [Roseateles koreensis]
MTSVWRIGYVDKPVPAKAALLASLGYGSTLGNGRWHLKGPHPIVYAGASRALCQLEKRVHANGAHPKNQALMRLELPAGAALADVGSMRLPADWRSNEAATQALGMAWLGSLSSLGLWVPSYVEPGDMNLLINPAHPEYRSIKLEIERNPFVFDPRMFP